MLPDHGHETTTTDLMESNHSHTYRRVKEEYKKGLITTSRVGFNAITNPVQYVVDATDVYEGKHTHQVTIEGRDSKEGKTHDGKVIVPLPRPPLIVLRYIIYWPD